MADSLTIRALTQSGVWETLGTGRRAGVVPESVELTANEWGSDTAAFDLRRNPGDLFPDLAARVPIEVEINGVLVWSGRLKETPSRDGTDPIINVQARGWQYHLDDDAYSKLYVHTGLGDWRDARTFAGADIVAAYIPSATVITDGGGFVVGWPLGDRTSQGAYVGVVLDLGPGNTGTRVVVNWEGQFTSTLYQVQIRASNDENTWNGSGAAAGPSANAATGAQTLAGTFSPRRYFAVQLNNITGGTADTTAETTVRIKGIQVFGSTAYESGNASILKASTILIDALTHATKLSDDQSQITASSFNIPEFFVGASAPKTVREVMEAANAFHNYVLKVDVLQRLVFQPRPTGARYEIGTWAGSTFEDSSMNSDEEVYNKVIVTGATPDGAPIQVTRTAVAPLLARTSETNTKILPIQSPLNVTVGNQIGDVFLNSHKFTPLKGTLVAQIGGVREVMSGVPVHPSVLLTKTTQLMRLSHRIDPDTGSLGRDGMISTVKYVHSDRSAELKLDNDRTSFQAFIERLAVVTGAAVQ